MQPKIEGVLLETPEEATIINPLAGRNKTDVEPGQLTRMEASMAFVRLDQQWQTLQVGAERDRRHMLAEELGIAIIRSYQMT